MKALLIDAAARDIREVEYGVTGAGSLPALQALVGGYIESAWSWDNGDVLFVDEEGLFKPQRHFFRLALRRDGRPYAGNGVLVGREVDDDSPAGYHTEPPTMTVEALRKLVTFLNRTQADAWAKGNASEPAVAITFIDADGKPQTDVIAHEGAIWSEMPKPTDE